jgi:hypothetical protein
MLRQDGLSTASLQYRSTDDGSRSTVCVTFVVCRQRLSDRGDRGQQINCEASGAVGTLRLRYSWKFADTRKAIVRLAARGLLDC